MGSGAIHPALIWLRKFQRRQDRKEKPEKNPIGGTRCSDSRKAHCVEGESTTKKKEKKKKGGGSEYHSGKGKLNDGAPLATHGPPSPRLLPPFGLPSPISPCPSLNFPPCPFNSSHVNRPQPPLSLTPAISWTRVTPPLPMSTARSKPPKLNWLRSWPTPAAPSNNSSVNVHLWRRRLPALSRTCHPSGGSPLNCSVISSS